MHPGSSPGAPTKKRIDIMDEFNLETLLKERDALLEKHPKLKEFQKSIDDILDKTPEQYRFSVVSLLLCQKFNQLNSVLQEFQKFSK